MIFIVSSNEWISGMMQSTCTVASGIDGPVCLNACRWVEGQRWNGSVVVVIMNGRLLLATAYCTYHCFLTIAHRFRACFVEFVSIRHMRHTARSMRMNEWIHPCDVIDAMPFLLTRVIMSLE